jgi:hypothetical protein
MISYHVSCYLEQPTVAFPVWVGPSLVERVLVSFVVACLVGSLGEEPKRTVGWFSPW